MIADPARAIARAEAIAATVAGSQYLECASWSAVRTSLLAAADALRSLSGQVTLPVELGRIMSERRVRSIDVAPLSGADGRLVPDGEGFRILVSQDTGEVRRRATIAHELGHTFFFDLRSGRPERLPRSRGRASRFHVREEDICWAFAAELLMPQGLVEELPALHNRSLLETAERIAARCRVSLEFALRRRLLKDIFPFTDCVALFSSDSGAGVQRVGRCWGSRARRSLPSQVSVLTTAVKSALREHSLALDPALNTLLADAREAAARSGVSVEWSERGLGTEHRVVVVIGPCSTVPPRIGLDGPAAHLPR
ncbi:MAG: ImmA/IrrE family metallo-endopeptidase [Candidatus Bipolaricaulota bacterium]